MNRMSRMSFVPSRRQAGVSLIEALLAAVLLGIGLLGTIGLQARAYSALSDAGMRAEATMAADKLLGVMSTDTSHLEDYVLAADEEPGERLEAWYEDTRSHIPGAAVTVSVDEGTAPDPSEVVIKITWQRKAGELAGKHEVRAFISGAM
ncbi:MAG: prepilin-type N-terminal cleavage/methylation domain-containing protein [Pseudomonadota bacterium]